MFTGVIRTIGEILAVEPLEEGLRLRLAAPWSGELAVGDSVAVDGCCLTVVDRDARSFATEAVPETLRRTILGSYAPGRRVHLERALRLGDRLDGHFVQGHVDRVGTVASMERHAENRYISIGLPAPEDLAWVAPQGSITVNGVSLTVLDVGAAAFRVSIVPHTWEATTFGDLAPGDPVNVEYDMIARYIKRFMEIR